MRQITKSNRHFILNNYKDFTVSQFDYWHCRLSKRIDYLKPLFKFIKKNDIDLFVISEDLSQEVFEIKELIKFLELFTSNKL
jgi:hypothetical protein